MCGVKLFLFVGCSSSINVDERGKALTKKEVSGKYKGWLTDYIFGQESHSAIKLEIYDDGTFEARPYISGKDHSDLSVR